MGRPKIKFKSPLKTTGTCGSCEYFQEENVRCVNEAYFDEYPEGIILEKGKNEEACGLHKLKIYSSSP